MERSPQQEVYDEAQRNVVARQILRTIAGFDIDLTHITYIDDVGVTDTEETIARRLAGATGQFFNEDQLEQLRAVGIEV
jgi:hypothetical protein